VFCDLDDTLFESHALSADGTARRALDLLERAHVPLVLCSSRTRAEIEGIHQALGISQPFVAESGAAVYVPEGYFAFRTEQAVAVPGYDVVEFGRPYSEVVEVLHRTADRLGVQIHAFSDMSVEDVARDSQLPLLQARLAKLREYSELFRIVDGGPGAGTHLLKALRAAGFVSTIHARHYQVGASRRDLGGYFLRGLFRRAFGEVVMVAFGDRESAVPLLVHADVPVVVHSDAAEEAARVMARVSAARLAFPGSLAAWAELILDIARTAQGSESPCWC
jgi:mannosyl-3-phosphoglycerate phosphatase